MSFVNLLVLVLHLICDTLHDLVPFVQFKKLEKRLWKTSVFYVSKRKQKADSLEFGSTKKL